MVLRAAIAYAQVEPLPDRAKTPESSFSEKKVQQPTRQTFTSVFIGSNGHLDVEDCLGF